MAYYIIGEKPIFISRDRDKQLRDRIGQDKTPLWRISSHIHDTAESREFQESCFNILQEEHRQNPGRFFEYWANIQISGEKAQENIWDILYDYCHFYQRGLLHDGRDFIEKITADYGREPDPLLFPMGKEFEFRLPIPIRQKWWQVFSRKESWLFRLIVNVEMVDSIFGTIESFAFVLGDSIIRCDKTGIVITPGKAREGLIKKSELKRLSIEALREAKGEGE